MIKNYVRKDKIIESINNNKKSGKPIFTKLATDERVLARITDGIYRQPISAIRELISNSYDADAINVHIHTDAPRFSKITIRDDGNGLTIEALANLIHHIGGSPKRKNEGKSLGVVNKSNPNLSPGSRKLIGKIGIGLFSVSQLTSHFQIITKRKNEKYRYFADVIMKTYTEDEMNKIGTLQKDEIETGEVEIWSEPANDLESHGTEIKLIELKTQAKELLQSRSEWRMFDNQEDDEKIYPHPKYHVGQFDEKENDIIKKSGSLPWDKKDAPEVKFKKLVQAVFDEVKISHINPQIEKILDYYLCMLWKLGLSAPVDYIDKHPFDTSGLDKINIYRLSNETAGQADQIKLKNNTKIRTKMKLVYPERGGMSEFNVFIDGIKILRPIKYTGYPETAHAMKKPLLFVGKYQPELLEIPKNIRGGELAFEAYIFWAPKIVPKEHQGVLIRINDANGTGFDENFMNYKVSEITRLSQITAEIFVTKGLDAALNIDRESFNFAHPHYQIITKWLHHAIRQFTNVHKRMSQNIRSNRREREERLRISSIEKIEREEILKENRKAETSRYVEIIHKSEDVEDARNKNTLVFEYDKVFDQIKVDKKLIQKVKSLISLLNAYQVFENMSYEKRDRLVKAIVRIFQDE